MNGHEPSKKSLGISHLRLSAPIKLTSLLIFGGCVGQESGQVDTSDTSDGGIVDEANFKKSEMNLSRVISAPTRYGTTIEFYEGPDGAIVVSEKGVSGAEGIPEAQDATGDLEEFYEQVTERDAPKAVRELAKRHAAYSARAAASMPSDAGKREEETNVAPSKPPTRKDLSWFPNNCWRSWNWSPSGYNNYTNGRSFCWGGATGYGRMYDGDVNNMFSRVESTQGTVTLSLRYRTWAQYDNAGSWSVSAGTWRWAAHWRTAGHPNPDFDSKIEIKDADGDLYWWFGQAVYCTLGGNDATSGGVHCNGGNY